MAESMASAFSALRDECPQLEARQWRTRWWRRAAVAVLTLLIVAISIVPFLHNFTSPFPVLLMMMLIFSGCDLLQRLVWR